MSVWDKVGSHKRVVAAQLERVLDFGRRLVVELVSVGVEVKHVGLNVAGAW